MQGAIHGRVFWNLNVCVPRPRGRRYGSHVLVRCQADSITRRQHAAATLLASATLQLAVQTPQPVHAAVIPVRAASAEHTLSIKRALLEDLLMKEMGSRLKSLSDDDLVTVLEQVHNGSFLLSLAAPSLHDPGTDDNPSSAPPRLSDNPPANPDAASLTDRQATHSFASSGSTSPQRDGTQSTEEQPATAPEAAVGKSPELPQTGQEGKAAGQSLPDAWQQQTYRLQAFTRPLMQRLQGTGSTLKAESEQQHANAETDTSPLSNLPQSSQRSSPNPLSSTQRPSEAQRQSEATEQSSQPTVKPKLQIQAQAREKEGIAAEEAARQRPSSEELSSSERAPVDPKPAAAVAEEWSSPGPANADQASEGLAPNRKGPNADEVDLTTQMLQSAGVPLPPPTSSQDPPATATVGQAPRNDRQADPTVSAYLGAIWRRTAPQLILLLVATTVSTVVSSLAQFSSARLTLAHTTLPAEDQRQRAPVQAAGESSQVNAVFQGLTVLSQATWAKLSGAGKGSRSAISSTEEASKAAESSVAGPQQLKTTFVEPLSSGVPGAEEQHQQRVNGSGNGILYGNGHSGGQPVELDEWGRSVLRLHDSSSHVGQQEQASGSENSAQQSSAPGPGTILWERRDPEEQQDLNGSAAPFDGSAPQTILWRRDQSGGSGPMNATVLSTPRFRRSRLHKHEVSVESLLDNVE